MSELNTKYICECCHRIKRPDPSLIKIDDRVRLIAEIAGQQRNMRGIVIDILDKHFLVQMPGDKTVMRDKVMVVPEDAPAPLDYIFKKVCACTGQKLSTVSVHNSAGVQAHV